MAGRILIVDDVATNRIVMKVKLAAACYAVDQAENGAEALRAARETKPDLILLDIMMPDMSGVEVCRALKADPETATIPVVLITALSDQDAKMEGLEAGADDFLTKPVEEVTLLARVRSLLRARDSVREWQAGNDTVAAFGFAESAAGFSARTAPGRIVLVAPGPRGAVLWKTAIENRIGGDIRILPREAALAEASTEEETEHPTDVFVISVDLAQRNEGLRLLSDLQSRPGTRHAAVVMILPEGDTERAAIALDLGANDVLHDPFDAKELAIRISAQLDRKRQSDRMRAGVKAGLEAAIHDPLTGLHNRRYAIPQLARMLERSGPGPAIMMVDLDHFKQVNDTHGHLAGDEILKQVADRLRRELRAADLLARIGGEEFLVSLSDSGDAMDCAQRLCQAIGEAPFDIGEGKAPVHVTVSIGLAHPTHDKAFTTPEILIHEADTALYRAKSKGRNQVSIVADTAA